MSLKMSSKEKSTLLATTAIHYQANGYQGELLKGKRWLENVTEHLRRISKTIFFLFSYF